MLLSRIEIADMLAEARANGRVSAGQVCGSGLRKAEVEGC